MTPRCIFVLFGPSGWQTRKSYSYGSVRLLTVTLPFWPFKISNFNSGVRIQWANCNCIHSPWSCFHPVEKMIRGLCLKFVKLVGLIDFLNEVNGCNIESELNVNWLFIWAALMLFQQRVSRVQSDEWTIYEVSNSEGIQANPPKNK